MTAWNPHIDWRSHSLSFSTSTPLDYDESVLPQQNLLCWLGVDVDQKLSALYSQRYPSEVDVSLRKHLPPKDSLDEFIYKINISTQMAQDAVKTQVGLLAETPETWSSLRH